MFTLTKILINLFFFLHIVSVLVPLMMHTAFLNVTYWEIYFITTLIS